MLNIKMIRDIRKNLSQFSTIFLMVLIGVMAYSGIEAYMGGMKETADKFYTENNLQDLNVLGVSFSKTDLEDIKNIEGVKNAERKLSVTGLTDNDKTLLINFIESNEISKFYVVDGEEFNAPKSGVWLDEFYANENDLKVGDTILVKYDSIELKEKILGLINVPDHLYDVRDESELYPDRKEFGFAYLSSNEIPEDYIRHVVMDEMGIKDEKSFNLYVKDFNYKDYIPFTNIMVDVQNKDKVNEVKNKIEETIDNAKAVIKIEDTSSYVTYQGEIDEGKTYIGVFSGLFLFIALLSVITTMTRVVKKERIEIGTLKALGFKDRKILIHYISYGLWISLIGAICGLILGYFIIGKIFISLEMAFFEIPNGHPVMDISSILVALLVVVIVSIISYFACKSILKENPAETLRNKIPSVSSKRLTITTKGILKNMNFQNKWNIRDIVRNKMRTFMGIVGVVGCCTLIVASFGMLDSMNYFVDLQFNKLYNFDYKFTLNENITDEELNNIKSNYGDKTSLALGIEIKDGNRKKSNNIFVTDAGNYVRFVDDRGKFTKLYRNDGIYVTYKLAKNEGYKLGDEISWHIYGSDKYYKSKIIGFNKDPQNQNITMTKDYYESLGLVYKPNALYTNKNLKDVKEIDGVEVIQDIDALEDGMTNMLSMMKTMLVLIISIAIILGVVIIYNLGILSYTEKQYQFATLKVLGFKDKQIKTIFTKQNNWIAVISIIIGLPLGFYLTDWLFKTAIEEHYDFGASITIKTYIISAIGTFLVSYIVSKYLARKINDIDMVSSLKGNE